MYLRSLVSAAALVALAACAPAHTQSVVKGGERSSGPLGLIKTDSIKADTPDAFKGLEKVSIGSFTMGFATYKTDSAKAGRGFGGKSTAKSTLKGIDDATMQKITDEAYKSFVSDLKSKGITVVDRKELTGFKGFAETKTYDAPYEDSNGGLFGASSITKYFVPSSFGKKFSVFAGDLAGFTGGIGFSNPSTIAANYAKETGVKVLNVVYVLDFANADSHGGSFTSTSGVSVGQGLTVIPEASKIGVIGGEGGTFSSAIGRVYLGQPITSEKEFAKVDDSTSDMHRGVEVATNVIGVLGGIGSNVSREYEFKARPADYKSAAIDAFKQANDALVGKIATLK